MLNSRKLKQFNPKRITSNSENITFAAKKALDTTKQIIYPQNYRKSNAQNKVLTCGIFFENLYNAYVKYLNIELTNPVLKNDKQFLSNPIKISDIEYYLMPKRYRGLFAEQDKSHYILRNHDEPLEVSQVFTVAKYKSQELEELLIKARTLIPTIYKTKWVDIPSNKGITKTVKEPDFAPKHAFSARFANDDQLKTVQTLCEIFEKIDTMTTTYQRPEYRLEYRYNELYPRYGAQNLYEEYQKELDQKNQYLRVKMFQNSRTK